MAEVHVSPLPDGVSQRYGWQVTRSGRRVSSHYKKSGAKRAAQSAARAGDTIVVHRLNGTVQNRIGV